VPVEPSAGWAGGGDDGDEDWHGDVIWPAETEPGIPWAGEVGVPVAGWPGDGQHGPGQAGSGRAGRPGGRGRPVASLVVVAVLAAGVGAGLTFALNSPSGTSAAATSTRGPDRASGQVPGGPAGRVPAGGSGGGPGGVPGGGQAEMLVMGSVTAVSATSITIGGNGPAVTAAVTAATRVTGQVSSIAGIKVGDEVSAQLTQQGGRVTAAAIQYPAQQPSGGGVAP
jgi:hypothetical protein